MLSTQKTTVSFSEYHEWTQCSWRHKLRYVDKIILAPPSAPALVFGTAMHKACQGFLNTRMMHVDEAKAYLSNEWKTFSGLPEFTEGALATALADAGPMLAEFPSFMDAQFKNWQIISIEEQLNESIVQHNDVTFKGYIDAVINCEPKRGKERIDWIVDLKTTNRGWFREKRSDESTLAQLAMYKAFRTKRDAVDQKGTRCAFVLLKRNAKPGEHCEMFPVSTGEVALERAFQRVNDMVASIKRGTAIKNRDACRWCEYKGTEHCK
jgi:hypothetical protein